MISVDKNLQYWPFFNKIPKENSWKTVHIHENLFTLFLSELDLKLYVKFSWEICYKISPTHEFRSKKGFPICLLSKARHQNSWRKETIRNLILESEYLSNFYSLVNLVFRISNSTFSNNNSFFKRLNKLMLF